MISRSLAVFAGVGAALGLAFGAYLVAAGGGAPLLFVDGPSVSVLTTSSEFAAGEPVPFRIVNSGSVPLSFPNTALGFRITGLSGILIFSPVSGQAITVLEPGESREFVWDQTKSDGDPAAPGLYKISVSGRNPDDPYGRGAMGHAVVSVAAGGREDPAPVDGPSVSVLTPSSEFAAGEPVPFRIVNSGSVPLSFPNTALGFKITDLSGILIFSPVSGQAITVLEPGESYESVWDQTDSDGYPVAPGLYNMSVNTIGSSPGGWAVGHAVVSVG